MAKKIRLTVQQRRIKRLCNLAKYGSRAVKTFIKKNGSETVAVILAGIKQKAYRTSCGMEG